MTLFFCRAGNAADAAAKNKMITKKIAPALAACVEKYLMGILFNAAERPETKDITKKIRGALAALEMD